MADNYVVSDANLTAIADAIRDNLGTENTLTFPEDFISGINGIVGAFHDVTSAPVASFSTDIATPLKSAVVEIEPVQAGSGDPSPDNVRAISGWSSINVWRSGHNCFPNDKEAGTEIVGNCTFEHDGHGNYRAYGTNVSGVSSSLIELQNEIVIPKSTNFSFCLNNNILNTNIILRLYDQNRELIDTWSCNAVKRVNSTYSLMAGKTLKYVDIQITGTVNNLNVYISPAFVLHEHQSDPFVEYTGYNQYSVLLQDTEGQPGTVYGGTLDVVSGLLTVNRKLYTWNAGASSAYLTSTNAYALPKSDVVTINTGNQSTLIGAVCDKFPSGTWASISAVSRSMAGCALGNALAFRVAGYTTKQEYEAFLSDNPLAFAYLVRESQTYQLAPTQIKALLGENNVWADAGNVAVAFKAKI